MIDLKEDMDLNSDIYKIKRTGYTFGGWYTDVTVSETKKDSVTFAETQADMDLYALWKPKTAKIHVNVGKGYDVNVTYDQSHVIDSQPEDSRYYCTGWYQNDKQILDGDGNVVDQATWNKAVLNASAEDDVVYTLTPEYAKYTIGTIDFKVKKTDGSEETAGKTVYFTEVPETVKVEGFPEAYKTVIVNNNDYFLFEGWYVGNTKVLDYDGKVVDKDIFTVDCSNTYTLYARWVKATFEIMPDNNFIDGESYFFTNVDARNANANGSGVYGVSAVQNEDKVSLNGTSVNKGIIGSKFTSMDVLHSVEWKFTANANSPTTGQLSNNGKYLHGEVNKNVYSLSVQDTETDTPWQFTKVGGPHRIFNSSCYL